MTVQAVKVALGERSYDVHVGAGAVTRLPDLLPPGSTRVAVVTQAGIPFAGAVSALLGIAPWCASTSAPARRASRW